MRGTHRQRASGERRLQAAAAAAPPMRQNANLVIRGQRVLLVPYRREHVAAYHEKMKVGPGVGVVSRQVGDRQRFNEQLMTRWSLHAAAPTCAPGLSWLACRTHRPSSCTSIPSNPLACCLFLGCRCVAPLCPAHPSRHPVRCIRGTRMCGCSAVNWTTTPLESWPHRHRCTGCRTRGYRS